MVPTWKYGMAESDLPDAPALAIPDMTGAAAFTDNARTLPWQFVGFFEDPFTSDQGADASRVQRSSVDRQAFAKSAAES